MSLKYILPVLVLSQFVCTLDFVFILPIWPDIAKNLNVGIELIAWVSFAYMIGAGLSSFILIYVIDRLNRKRVLLGGLLGIFISSLLCAFSNQVEFLIGARVLAGLFAAPITATILSIIGDTTKVEKRGKYSGIIIMAYPLSAVLGVPVSILLSGWFSWEYSFFLVAVLAFLSIILVQILLPSLTDHVSQKNAKLQSNSGTLEFSIIPLIGFAVFPLYIVLPHLSAIIQYNFGIDRDDLSLLYLSAGFVNIIVTILTGKLVDKFGEHIIILSVALVLSIDFMLWFVLGIKLSIYLYYFIFIASASSILIPIISITTKISPMERRAGLASRQTVFQYLFIGIAVIVSYSVVTMGNQQGHDINSIPHLDYLGVIGILSVLCFVFYFQFFVYSRYKKIHF